MDFSRRTFMKVAAIGGATLASDSGIKQVGKLVPYVYRPRRCRPSTWHTIATTCRECPAGCGMHVRHNNGQDHQSRRQSRSSGEPRRTVRPRPVRAAGHLRPGPGRRSACPGQRTGPFRQETWQKAHLPRSGSGCRKAKGRVAVMSRLETGTLAEIMTAFAGSFGSDRLLVLRSLSLRSAPQGPRHPARPARHPLLPSGRRRLHPELRRGLSRDLGLERSVRLAVRGHARTEGRKDRPLRLCRPPALHDRGQCGQVRSRSRPAGKRTLPLPCSRSWLTRTWYEQAAR